LHSVITIPVRLLISNGSANISLNIIYDKLALRPVNIAHNEVNDTSVHDLVFNNFIVWGNPLSDNNRIETNANIFTITVKIGIYNSTVKCVLVANRNNQ
jgi:hypothetical protein